MQMEEKREGHLIVGLGNPESDYADTRHNLGFACVRELGRRLGVPIDKKRWQSLVGHSDERGVWLALPQTFMNLSGQAVAKALKDTRLTPEQTWVVYDELDLPLCRMRIRKGGSGAGHNGVRSLVESLGTDAFVRFRVGRGRPATHVSAEVAVSFLDRPPACDEAVNRRLEALTALLDAEREPVVIVSSRRAITRQTISPHDLAESTVVLAPGRGPNPLTVAGRLVEFGYSREPLVEERGQFSLRGGILDVFPAAADAPVRADGSGDAGTRLDETAMLAAAEAGGGELPRQFVLPTVHRLDDLGARPRLAVTAAEGAPDAADLGWFQGEPLVGQPRALAGLAERSDGAAVVFATEQDERLRALLDAAKVGSPLREVDLDVDLDLEPVLARAAVDIAAGCAQPGLRCHLSTD